MPIALAELLALVWPLIKEAMPEVKAIFLAWLGKHRARLEQEIPDTIQEIDRAIANAGLDDLSQLVYRLHERAAHGPAARESGAPAGPHP